MSHRLLDEFKQSIEYDLADATKDDKLSLALSSAESMIEATYGVPIGLKEVEIVFDGDGSNTVFTEYYNPSFVSLTIDGVTIASTEVYFKNNYLRLKTLTFTSGIQNCILKISVGFTDLLLPDSIRMGLFKLANKIFVDMDEAREGVTSYSTGTKTGMVFVQKHLPDTFELLIQPYRSIYL